MDIFQLIILGIVEGFTEFLPISSTAHLILTSRLLGLHESEFLKSFTIAIQLGAIFAVVLLYARRLVVDWEMNKRVLVAFLPTAVIGFGLYKIIKGIFFENIGVIILALFVGGVFLILFERFYKGHDEKGGTEVVSYTQAFLIGCAQACAVVPGVSRAGATIVGGMLLGVPRKAIVEFSFLLAIPTMAAATGYDLLKSGDGFTPDQFSLLAIGFVFSFFFALLGVRFFLHYIQHKSFIGFGVYRIAISFILGVYLLFWS